MFISAPSQLPTGPHIRYTWCNRWSVNYICLRRFGLLSRGKYSTIWKFRSIITGKLTRSGLWLLFSHWRESWWTSLWWASLWSVLPQFRCDPKSNRGSFGHVRTSWVCLSLDNLYSGRQRKPLRWWPTLVCLLGSEASGHHHRPLYK
jgi:hypothetical protein